MVSKWRFSISSFFAFAKVFYAKRRFDQVIREIIVGEPFRFRKKKIPSAYSLARRFIHVLIDLVMLVIVP